VGVHEKPALVGIRSDSTSGGGDSSIGTVPEKRQDNNDSHQSGLHGGIDAERARERKEIQMCFLVEGVFGCKGGVLSFSIDRIDRIYESLADKKVRRGGLALGKVGLVQIFVEPAARGRYQIFE
jgi:hypothetical protein